MANKIKLVSIIREIIRLKANGNGIKKICRKLRVSRNTVRKYLRELKAKDLSLPRALQMSVSIR